MQQFYEKLSIKLNERSKKKDEVVRIIIEAMGINNC